MSATWWSECIQIWMGNGVTGLIIKTSLVLIGILGVAQLRKGASAAQRHIYWSIGLAMLLFIPIWQTAGPQIAFEVPGIVPDSQAPPISIQIRDTTPNEIDTDHNTTTETSLVMAPARSSGLSLASALEWLYFGVFSGFLLHLMLGLIGIAFLTKKAQPMSDRDSLELVSAIAKSLNIKRPIHCFMSQQVQMPFTWGFLKPKIILPVGFKDWPIATKRNVVTHEMAHILRGDWLTGILARFSMMIHWYNPLAWKALSRLRLEAERACDDLVLTSGNPATQYADQLLGFVTQAKQLQFASVAMAPMACRSDFSERMHSILDKHERRQSMKMIHAFSAILLALSLTGLMAGVQLRAQSNQGPSTVDRSFIENILGSALDNRLIEAVERGDVNQSEKLIQAGADVNYNRSGDGNPLIIAANRGNQEMASLLLENGANVNQPSAGDGSALIQAAYQRDLPMATLLLDAGADVNLGVHGDGAPLQVAISRRHPGLVNLFLDHGADVNLAVPGDGNPLIAAAHNGDLATAQKLLSLGADIDGFVLSDETPLIQAVLANEYEMAAYLIENGANVNKAVPRNHFGEKRSPMSAALSRGNSDMIELLRSHGAKSHK